MNEFLLQYMPLTLYLLMLAIVGTVQYLIIIELITYYLDMSPESKKICIAIQTNAACILAHVYIKLNPRIPQEQPGYVYTLVFGAILLTTVVFTYFNTTTVLSQKKE